jgi:DNA polymerase I-like protein with 3'-5' exonuclease and polymerase domains
VTLTHRAIPGLTDELDLGGLPWFLTDPDPSTYLVDDFLVMDLETTNTEYGSALVPENRVVCAAWYRKGDTTVSFERADELHQFALIAAIESTLEAGGFIVAHNAKFELQWLQRMGIDLRTVLVYDTQIGEYVLAGNRGNKAGWKLNLNAVAQRYGCTPKGTYVDRMMNAGVCPSAMNPALLRARVIKDVKDTTRVFLQQRERLDVEGKLSLQYTRCLLTPVLADIETNGIGLSNEHVQAAYEKAKTEYDVLLLQFNEMTGGINARSAPQMAHFVYGELGFKELKNRRGEYIRNKASKQFPKGVPKVDNTTLGKLTASNKRQREFLELRAKLGKLNAQLTKTLEFFKGVCDEYDCTFYGSFNQTVTVTHRLSSNGRNLQFSTHKKPKGIQLQNLPNAFKHCIGPKRKGYKFGNADGSQLEFRVAAFVGQDTKAIWNIMHDVDQHCLSASVMRDYTYEAFMAGYGASETRKQYGEWRRLAKPDTFKPLYGGTRGTATQEKYYKWFAEEYAELHATQVGWTYEVLADQRLRMPWGIEFYFPYTHQDPRTGYIDNTPSIFNYPVQSLATAEIIPIAMVYMWHRIGVNAPEIELTNTVHDSVTGEIPDGLEDMWTLLAQQCFTMDVYAYLDEVYGLDFNVPLGVGVEIGSQWGSEDSTEVEINVLQSGEWWTKGDRAVQST